MENMTETSCRAFAEALASKAPVPGGGGLHVQPGAVQGAPGEDSPSAHVGKHHGAGAMNQEADGMVEKYWKIAEGVYQSVMGRYS